MNHLLKFESYFLIQEIVEWKQLGLDYEFEIDGIKFRVKFSAKEGDVNLSFLANSDGDWDYRDLKSSNPYKTMNVISEIVKDFIENNPKVTRIKFFGREDIKGQAPDWIFNIITSHPVIYYLASHLDLMLNNPTQLLNRPRQWFIKPSKRTKIFNRWVDREVGKSIKNWKVKRIGNEIQLVRN